MPEFLPSTSYVEHQRQWWLALAAELVTASMATRSTDPVLYRVFDLAREAALRKANDG